MHVFKMQNQTMYQTPCWVLWDWDCGSLFCAIWSYWRLTLSANNWAPLKPPQCLHLPREPRKEVVCSGLCHQGSEVINIREHIVQ